MILRLASLSILAVALAGCGNEQPAASTADKGTPAAAPALPAGLIVDSIADAKPLRDVIPTLKTGDTVAFTGYIGGRVDPFTNNRAIFLVADVKNAPACEGDDHCKTPWDACCAPTEDVAANSATVQIVDADGAALKMSLTGSESPLRPGAEVAINGKVREAGGTFLVIDAQQIALLPPAAK